MDFQINLLKKTERRYQGMVSMKGIVLGSVSVLVSVGIMVFLLAWISNLSLHADLQRARMEWEGLSLQELAVRSARAATASNTKMLAALECPGTADRPPMYSVLRAVQENVPPQMELYHFSAGVEQGSEQGPLMCTLRISGTATGELTAVDARRQLNADARLRGFCGEIRLVSSKRYLGESWAFALEGRRLTEGDRE